jgi:hypothetical protein
MLVGFSVASRRENDLNIFVEVYFTISIAAFTKIYYCVKFQCRGEP